MITGISNFKQILREVKKDEMENMQIHRERAESQFDQEIATLQAQVSLLKEQASKIGKAGMFGFIMSLVTTVINIATSFLGGAQMMASMALQKILTVALNALQQVLTAVQNLVNSSHQKDMKNMDAQNSDLGTKAKTFEKLHQEAKEESQESKKRANEAFQTLKEAQKEIHEAHEAMVVKS